MKYISVRWTPGAELQIGQARVVMAHSDTHHFRGYNVCITDFQDNTGKLAAAYYRALCRAINQIALRENRYRTVFRV